MKQKNQIYILAVCIAIFIAMGSFSATASSLDNSETTQITTEQSSVEQEISPNSTEENMQETATTISTEQVTLTENATEMQTIETPEEVSEIEVEQTEESVEETEEFLEETEESNEEIATISDINIETGKYYFFQKYLYDCNVVYLEKYIAYLQLQVTACEQVYQMGNTTETVLKSYQAQKELAEAELTVAKNESTYNNLYLSKNQIDYSDFDMKEVKKVESVDYYIENYPEIDYMKLARYVTDCNNAIAEIRAKKVEISALETDIEMAELLLQEGEISQLEYKEKEVSLAKAQFELEQQYVEMNVAYWQLMILCESNM